jgi:predicted TIM-barrel fold metal-dependent hydrolase
MASGAILSSKAGALDAQQPAGHTHNPAQPQQQPQQDISPDVLLLKDYHPRSIFKIPVTKVEKAKYPVIDVHNHGAHGADGVATTVKVMDAVNFEKAIIFVGHTTSAEEFTAAAESYLKYPGRFELWTNFSLSGIDEPGFETKAVAALEAAHRAGAVGIGEIVDKGRGVTAGMDVTRPMGPHADDPRLDALWDRCAKLGMPVNLHVSDPIWGYLPQNQFNDGLMNGFKWRLDNKPDIMGHDDLIASFERVAGKHPKTVFIAAHLMNLTYDLTRLGQIFERNPNVYADVSARFWEVAATPRAALRFFEKYPDRVVYGTDSSGYQHTGMRATFRIFETDDEHFYDYPQYHWPQSGLNLPDPILKKLYRDNALRALKQARG